MATLSPKSAAAIARLRSYIPPASTSWYQLPLSRRAAVLILLYADRKGDLRVVLTMRSSTLKSYSGQAALPGGKADSITESPMDCARREANEEIGLPLPLITPSPVSTGEPATAVAGPSASVVTETKHSPETPGLPYPFKIEHLCQMPTNLARTELGVRPCVAFLYATSPVDRHNKPVDAESTLIPRLDAREVAAVFSAPFHNFLSERDETPEARKVEGSWYKGTWIDWHETKWRMHSFYVPVRGQTVTRPSQSQQQQQQQADSSTDPASEKTTGPSGAETPLQRPRTRSQTSQLPYRDHPAPYSPTNPDPLDGLARFRVFGMTARLLVDCARVAYAEEPQFEHNSHFGDEAIIQQLIKVGRMGGERQRGDEFTNEDVRDSLSRASSLSSNRSEGKETPSKNDEQQQQQQHGHGKL